MDTMQQSSSTTNFEPPVTNAAPPRRRVLFRCLLCLTAGAAALWLLNRLLIPKYMDTLVEGALAAEYYDSAQNHELIIVGDCEAYENISPVTLWREFGIPSHIRGTPQQLAWQSYYLLEDTLRRETPKAVLFSVLALKYNEPQNEAYNRLTLDGMRLGPSKIAAAAASMTEGESLASYLLPLLRYHERWKSLGGDDFRYLFTREPVSHNGFLMRADTKPLTRLPTPPVLRDNRLGENAMSYLDKMRVLCEHEGVTLVLYKAPTPYPHWYGEWDTQVADYADRHGLLYINALDAVGEIGIDLRTDTYDGGLHLNLSGAERFSRYLGALLQEGLGLADLRSEAAYKETWDDICAAYDAHRDIQLREIAETGKVSTLTKGRLP